MSFLSLCFTMAIILVLLPPPRDRKTGKRPKRLDYWEELGTKSGRDRMYKEKMQYREEMRHKADLYAHKRNPESEARIKKFSESIHKTLCP